MKTGDTDALNLITSVTVLHLISYFCFICITFLVNIFHMQNARANVNATETEPVDTKCITSFGKS